MLLDDTQGEGLRLKDMNSRLFSENQQVKRQVDQLLSETYEQRKEYEYNQSRNADMGAQIRDLEMKLKEKEEQGFMLRKDVENQKQNNFAMKDNNGELLGEKEALEKHAQIL